MQSSKTEFLIIYCLAQNQVLGKILVGKLLPKMLTANQICCILRLVISPELIDVPLLYNYFMQSIVFIQINNHAKRI